MDLNRLSIINSSRLLNFMLLILPEIRETQGKGGNSVGNRAAANSYVLLHFL